MLRYFSIIPYEVTEQIVGAVNLRLRKSWCRLGRVAGQSTCGRTRCVPGSAGLRLPWGLAPDFVAVCQKHRDAGGTTQASAGSQPRERRVDCREPGGGFGGQRLGCSGLVCLSPSSPTLFVLSRVPHFVRATPCGAGGDGAQAFTSEFWGCSPIEYFRSQNWGRMSMQSFRCLHTASLLLLFLKLLRYGETCPRPDF